jgi:hypothetical protein
MRLDAMQLGVDGDLLRIEGVCSSDEVRTPAIMRSEKRRIV